MHCFQPYGEKWMLFFKFALPLNVWKDWAHYNATPEAIYWFKIIVMCTFESYLWRPWTWNIQRKHQEETYDSKESNLWICFQVHLLFFLLWGRGVGCVRSKYLSQMFVQGIQFRPSKKHTNEGLCTERNICASQIGDKQKRQGNVFRGFNLLFHQGNRQAYCHAPSERKPEDCRIIYCIKKCIDKLYQGSPFSLVFVNAKDTPFALNKTGETEREVPWQVTWNSTYKDSQSRAGSFAESHYLPIAKLQVCGGMLIFAQSRPRVPPPGTIMGVQVEFGGDRIKLSPPAVC